MEKYESQNPLITGLEPGTFDTRGRRFTSAPLSSTVIDMWEMVKTCAIKSKYDFVCVPYNGDLKKIAINIYI